ncbi:MAG: hypothetical protein NC124_18600 [Clostridium sp.]|nr:hypothetical protein [Clostridium sp.]
MMKIESLYVGNQYSDSGVWNQKSEVKQTDEQQRKSQEMIDHAASMEISRRGFAMAQELEAFDGEEVYNMRVELLRDASNPASIIDGSFVGKVAEQYKSMADDIQEKYSGNEYERQMGILDKAYNEAKDSLAKQYTRQMRILSGDIVINTTVKSYSTHAEAEAALNEPDITKKAGEEVISNEKGEQMNGDVLKYLEAAKASVLDKGFFDWKNLKGVKADVLNIMDLQKMGAFFLDKKHQTDVSGVSSFVSEILSAYTNS